MIASRKECHIWIKMASECDVIVEGFPLTRGWIQKMVGAKHGKQATISKVSPLGAEAIGYMSLIRRVELEWDSEENDLPKSVIVKLSSCAAASEAMSSGTGAENNTNQMDTVQRLFHNTETAYLKLFSKVPSLRIPVPTIYEALDFSSDSPCILMKDYGDCHIVDLIDGFNEKQLYAIVDAIVEIQAYPILNDEWKEIKQPPEYATVMGNFSGQLQAICQQLMQNIPEVFGVIQRFVDNTFAKDEQWMWKDLEPYLNGDRVSVLCHGDLWSPQILWKDDVTIGAIVDWQASRAGSPVEDLLRILSTCTSTENRRTLLRPLLDHLHSKLSERVTSEGGSVPFTREQLDEEVKKSMVPGCMMTIFANAFWANSHVLKPNGIPDEHRTNTSFARCRAYIDDTLEAHGW